MGETLQTLGTWRIIGNPITGGLQLTKLWMGQFSSGTFYPGLLTTKWDDPPRQPKSNKALYNSKELAYYRDSAKKSGDIGV